MAETGGIVSEDLIQAVWTRIADIQAAEDTSLAVCPDAIDEAKRLDDALGALPPTEQNLTGCHSAREFGARFALGWLYWYQVTALPDDQNARGAALTSAIEMLAPCFITDLDPLPEPLIPMLADASAGVASDLLVQAETRTAPAFQSFVVGLWQRITAATTVDHPAHAGRLASLSGALQFRFNQTRSAEDLHEAIRLKRVAVTLFDAGTPMRGWLMNNLCLLLRSRHLRSGMLEDLDEAVRAGEESVRGTPEKDATRAGRLNNLGLALRTRFELYGVLADIEEAVRACRSAIECTHLGPTPPLYLSNLGRALLMRFRHNDAEPDLDEAVRAAQEAVRTSCSDEPAEFRGMYLGNLSDALMSRYELAGASNDLDEAIRLACEAARITPPDHPDQAMHLRNASTALRTRYERTSSLLDLNESVAAIRKALDSTAVSELDRPALLSELTTTLWTRFERSGETADLDNAIQAGYEAVRTASAHRQGKSIYLINLSIALRLRFTQTGALKDLDEAIRLCREAVDPAASGPGRSDAVFNLAGALQLRFQRTGALEDIDEAVQLGREDVKATAVSRIDRASSLSNLSISLRTRFVRTKALEDLDEAIRLGRAAVRATDANHARRPGRISNVGLCLRIRYAHTKSLGDVNNAISFMRHAVQCCPADTYERALHLTTLGAVLQDRFATSGKMRDLEEAIRVSREAVHVIPFNHPDRAGMSFNLGLALRGLFERTKHPAHLNKCLTAFSEAVGTVSGAPSVRIRAAKAAAPLAAAARPNYAAEMLGAAVRLLPEVAPRQLQRRDQQHALDGLSGLASDAAAFALLHQDPTTSDEQRAACALGLLEQGRAVLLSQALHTRSDLTELWQLHPDLAARYVQLRDLSDATSLTTEELSKIPADDRHRLATQFAATVAEIRLRKGFEFFHLPPPPEELINEAHQGPVVVFNVSRYRSDALLVTTDGIRNLRLPALDVDSVAGHISSFHRALHIAHDLDASPTQRQGAQDTLNQVLEWLWGAAMEPVLDELDFTEEPEADAWPRVWWAPGGLLSLLPLHAAGYHRESPHQTGLAAKASRRTVMDRVVSSYTPTVRALSYARQRVSSSRPGGKALIVAMPTTPGATPLRHVSDEVTALRARLPQYTLVPEPTKAEVLAHLPEHAIAHFACHGTVDPVDPSHSHLLLHDHQTNPLTVASLAPIALTRARLAYLSACRTAFSGALTLADEAIHLTTAFQLAGFCHVIGTLWEIDDRRAVGIADTFYSLLWADAGGIDDSRSAHALHRTIRATRSRLPAVPSLWAAYLHAGA